LSRPTEAMIDVRPGPLRSARIAFAALAEYVAIALGQTITAFAIPGN
jgi:hypothetical protein